MSDRITGTCFSLTWKDYDLTFLVFDYSDPDSAGGFADSSLPEHAVGLFADRDLAGLHSSFYEFSEKSDSSRGPLLSWSVPYPVKVEVVEFLFNNL
jgi:hypothetical protein